jgi:hypothetical protein
VPIPAAPDQREAIMSAHRQLFLSAVSSEFQSYRELLAGDLKRPNLDVKVQEDFVTTGGHTLGKLDEYIRYCDAVIHLIGKATGSVPGKAAVSALLRKYPDLPDRLPSLADRLRLPQPGFSYTQWEAYLAIYHDRAVYIYRPTDDAPRDPKFKPDPAQEQSQSEHYQRLSDLDRDRGQFANQERLSSAVLRDLVEILPALQSTVAVEPTRLHHAAERLIGREADLIGLDQLWADEHKHVVVIRAWGGVGKTSLAAEWMAEMARKDWRGARRVFDWSFYSQGKRSGGDGDKAASADAFIAAALTFFGDPDPVAGSPWDRGARLARLVGATKSLLVLDGLEPLQHPPGPLAGQLKDPAVAAMLKGLAARNEGLCLVTTREKVDDLKSFYGKTAEHRELSHLSEETGAELLRVLGVQGTAKERRAASKEVRGHALTLHLMGRYLALAHEGDVRKRDLFEFSEADDEVQGGHAFRVLKAYETWLASSGEQGRRQLAILRLLGLFDRPADPLCLAALRQEPAIAELTDDLAGISDAQWNIAVKRLEEIGLVAPVEYKRLVVKGYDEKQAEDSIKHPSLTVEDLFKPEEVRPSGILCLSTAFSLESHPLLREHFAKQLRETADTAWREGHRRLFAHLQASVPYWPEGVDGLGPLYQAVAHGCQAGLEQQACDDVYCDRILRGTQSGGFYSTKNLGVFGADLGAVASFFTQPWHTVSANLSPTDQAWLLTTAALNLRALGRLSEAVEPMRVGLETIVVQEDWKNAAIGAGNVSQLELTLGEVSVALADAEQSVDYADRSKDPFQRMGKYATFADALHQAGRREEALRTFRQAEDLQAENRFDYPRLCSLPGFWYCDLLLADAERAGWRVTMGKAPEADITQLSSECEGVAERAAYAREIAIRHRSLLEIGLDHLTTTRAAFYGSLLDPAVSPDHFRRSARQGSASCDAAVDGLRRSGDTSYLPQGLLTRAWLHFVLADAEGCRADLDEAWEIALRGPMRLHMADILLTRARLFRDRDALAEARTLIEQCGYGRRKEELADAEAALA